MKNSVLKIQDAVIQPGERITLALPLPETYTCAPMYMPIQIIHGKQQGPCLLLIAAMHGDEINGTAIIHRLLKLSLLKKLKGTLIAIPAINVHGIINRSRFMPDDNLLDDAFPGAENGNYSQRVAHIVTKELLSKANYVIQLKTGDQHQSNLPCIFTNLDEPDSKALGQAFQTPVMIQSPSSHNSWRKTTSNHHLPTLVYQGGEALSFDVQATKTALRGIINVMRHVGMLQSPANRMVTKQYIANRTTWIRASRGGLVEQVAQFGKQVTKGDLLADIIDPFGTSARISVKAPHNGIIIAMNNNPLIHEGEKLFQIATFDAIDQAESSFEKWQQ